MSDEADWMEEARLDLQAAASLGHARLYAHACAHCHQALDKALKALLIYKRGRPEQIHSLRQLADQAGVLDELRNLIATVDADYAATWYFEIIGSPSRSLFSHQMFRAHYLAASTALEMIEGWMRDSRN